VKFYTNLGDAFFAVDFSAERGQLQLATGPVFGGEAAARRWQATACHRAQWRACEPVGAAPLDGVGLESKP